MALGLLWAALAAVATNMAVGMLWYSVLFAKPFVRAIGMDKLTEAQTKELQKAAMPGYFISMLSAVVATVLLWYLYGWADGMPEGYAPWLKGLVLGVTAWLGFYVGPSLTGTFFENRDWTVWAIGAGYWGVLAALYGVYVGVFH